MDFVAVDVETANADLASICQIGLVVFERGRVVRTWETLVDPAAPFDPVNESIHGITAEDVRGAPSFRDLYPDLRRALGDGVVASHTAFDRVALTRSVVRDGLDALTCSWLDTARVVRRTWPQCAASGYGLGAVCEMLQIDFDHHRALDDARAAGEILVRAISETGISLDAWTVRVTQPLSGSGSVARSGNPDGTLAGERIAFTGALSLGRREAADLAAQAGCDVLDAVNKHTTLLVVGDQDATRLVGHEKSSKHRKAEHLIAKGQPLRILTESDFLALCAAR